RAGQQGTRRLIGTDTAKHQPPLVDHGVQGELLEGQVPMRRIGGNCRATQSQFARGSVDQRLADYAAATDNDRIEHRQAARLESSFLDERLCLSAQLVRKMLAQQSIQINLRELA